MAKIHIDGKLPPVERDSLAAFEIALGSAAAGGGTFTATPARLTKTILFRANQNVTAAADVDYDELTVTLTDSFSGRSFTIAFPGNFDRTRVGTPIEFPIQTKSDIVVTNSNSSNAINIEITMCYDLSAG
tara:strand:+ start:194 stop:583 length:390 start_codon:yes stop_codon:yes gene_type:complete